MASAETQQVLHQIETNKQAVQKLKAQQKEAKKKALEEYVENKKRERLEWMSKMEALSKDKQAHIPPILSDIDELNRLADKLEVTLRGRLNDDPEGGSRSTPGFDSAPKPVSLEGFKYNGTPSRTSSSGLNSYGAEAGAGSYNADGTRQPSGNYNADGTRRPSGNYKFDESSFGAAQARPNNGNGYQSDPYGQRGGEQYRSNNPLASTSTESYHSNGASEPYGSSARPYDASNFNSTNNPHDAGGSVTGSATSSGGTKVSSDLRTARPRSGFGADYTVIGAATPSPVSGANSGLASTLSDMRAELERKREQQRLEREREENEARLAELEAQRKATQLLEEQRLKYEAELRKRDQLRHDLEEQRRRLDEENERANQSGQKQLVNVVKRLDKYDRMKESPSPVSSPANNKGIVETEEQRRRRREREEEERRRLEEEERRHAIARVVVGEAIASEPNYDPSAREWIKNINEYSGNANTIKAKVLSTDTPDMLSFREKMIRFAAKQET